MNVEAHVKNLKESLELIDESIEKGLVERQRTIGFNTSAASADMLEIFLHKNGLIDQGTVIKHEWLKSKNKIEDKLPFDFPHKNEILGLMLRIEEKRNALCYGKPQKREVLEEIIMTFNSLRELFREVGIDEA